MKLNKLYSSTIHKKEISIIEKSTPPHGLKFGITEAPAGVSTFTIMETETLARLQGRRTTARPRFPFGDTQVGG